MKLQRKWARVATVFIVAAVLLLSAAGLMTELRPDIMRAEEIARYDRILSLLMFGSVASAAGMLAVMRKHVLFALQSAERQPVAETGNAPLLFQMRRGVGI